MENLKATFLVEISIGNAGYICVSGIPTKSCSAEMNLYQQLQLAEVSVSLSLPR